MLEKRMSQKTWIFMPVSSQEIVNLGYWDLGNMNYSTSGSPITIGSGSSTMNNKIASSPVSGGTPNTLTVDANTSNILGTLGITLEDNTLTYFGFNKSGLGPGSFVICFKATSAITLFLNATPNAGSGSNGAISTQSASSSAFIGGGFLAEFSIASNSTFVLILGDYNALDGFSLNISRSSGASTFKISYLTYNGTTYENYASATNATASGLNIATYHTE
jgi:hypothetical protein